MPDVRARIRLALTGMYAWFRRNGDDLYPIYRDFRSIPPSAQEGMRNESAMLVGALLGPESRERTGPRVRAAVGHALDFWTWRSLAVDRGLPDEDCVELALGMIEAAVDRDAEGG
jgi:hypothetical protein